MGHKTFKVRTAMSLNKTMRFICLGVLLVLGQVSSNPDPSMDKMETVMVNKAKQDVNVEDLFKTDNMDLDIGLKHEEANSGTPSRNEEDIPDEERYEEDIGDENDLINRELWEKSLQSARRPGQPMTLNPS